jgi:hypothetical protein
MISLILTLFFHVMASCEQDSYNVYFIAGQSNAVGTARVADIPGHFQMIKEKHTHKQVWNYQQQSLEELNLGVNNNLLHGWFENFGPEAMIGHRLLEIENKPFIILKYAKVGTNLHSEWNSRISGSLYFKMIETTKKLESYLRTMGKTPCYQAFFWSQGGADTGPHDVDDYADHLENFINDLRTDLNSPLMPFITARLNRVKDESRFHKEQDKVTKRVKAFKIIETSDLEQDPDSIHFNANGQIPFGNRFYEAYLHLKQEIESGLNSKFLKIYPVPFKQEMDVLNLEVNNNFYCSELNIQFVDMLGRIVFEKNNVETEIGAKSKVEILKDELIHLSSGAYIVSIHLNQCSVVLKDNDRQLHTKIIYL